MTTSSLSFGATAVLGGAAGLTICIGLLIARLRRPTAPLMSLLTSASVGILLFILYDVIKNASAPIEAALGAHQGGTATLDAVVLVAGLCAGVFGLVVFEHVMPRRPAGSGGPGAMSATVHAGPAGMTAAQRVALTIAVGIGLHNFSEGLAIGQSAASGVYRLFALLVIGFGLHNITEGFGITGPLIGERPTWRFLALLGLVGGGPTFLGTLIGYQFRSDVVAILFLALAAGAIMYVIGELQHASRKIGSHDLAMAGLVTGFVAAYATDLLLSAVGA